MKEDNNQEYEFYANECDGDYAKWLMNLLFTETDSLDVEYVGDYTIDTCETPDCGWETAIRKDTMYKSGRWVVVARYKDKESAQKGHYIWASMCAANPTKVWSVQLNEYVEF